VGGDQGVDRGPGLIVLRPSDDAIAFEAGFVEDGCEFLVEDRGARLLSFQHLGELRASEVGVEKQQVDAEP
jgi:hypothetical protein